MSGYPNQPPMNPGGIYPTVYHPVNGAPQQYPAPGYPGQPPAYQPAPGYPGQPAPGYQQPGPYPYQPGFAVGQPGQPGQPGHPAAMSYPGINPTPIVPTPTAPSYAYPGFPNVTPAQGFGRTMPYGKLHEFDYNGRGNWDAYVRLVEQYILLNEVKAELRVAMLLTHVGPATYELMCDLCAPFHPEDKRFEELVALVREHLEPKRSEVAERHLFRQRRQGKQENVVGFLQSLKHLATHCKFGASLEENIRDQFVSGLRSDEMRSRLFAEPTLDYKKAVELALALEAAERNAEIEAAGSTAGAPGSLETRLPQQSGDWLHRVAATAAAAGCTRGRQPWRCDQIEWIPTTVRDASALGDRAVIGGYEGHDGSPLWVIRAHFEGDVIPGKLAAKHNAAYVAWDGRENTVQNIEVLCARPEKLKWQETSHGSIPPHAVVGGRTSSGEPLYVGRAKEQGSLTPGKVHPSHKVMYISFAGREIAHKNYEILCQVV